MTHELNDGSTVIIIPARLDSKRLPGKMLLNTPNGSLITTTYWNIAGWWGEDNIIVATDSKIIINHCEEYDIPVVRTYPECRNGTERCHWASLRYDDYEYVINIQGDCPDISQEDVEEVIKTTKDVLNMDKIVTANYTTDNHVLYSEDEGYIRGSVSKHLGIYGYTKSLLEEYANTKPSRDERINSLEQMRLGRERLAVIEAVKPASSIDTFEDYEEYCNKQL
jgi:3-deoxy-manno-octulosonate cytidylyltransferase (CMP-KDO synthetase)